MPTTRSGKRTRVPCRATELATMLEAGLGMGHTFVVERHQRGHFELLRTFNSELRRQVHDVLQSELGLARSAIQTRGVRPSMQSSAV